MRAQQLGVADGLVAGEIDGIQPVTVALLDGNGNVHHLAAAALEEGKVQQAVFVAHLGLGIFH